MDDVRLQEAAMDRPGCTCDLDARVLRRRVASMANAMGVSAILLTAAGCETYRPSPTPTHGGLAQPPDQASATGGDVGNESPLQHAATVSGDDLMSASPETLAALAQQNTDDVARFLAQQNQAREVDRPSTTGDGAAPDPGRVRWNGEAPSSAPPPSGAMPPQSSDPWETVRWSDGLADGQPSSAAESGSFRQGPLFRSEPELNAIEPLPPAPGMPNRNMDDTSRDADPVQALLADLTRELYLESSYSNMPLRQLLVIAAHAIVRPDRALTAEALPNLSEDDAAVLDLFQSFCLSLGEKLEGSDDARDVLTNALQGLVSDLDDTPPLTLATMAICYSVDGFGNYESFDDLAFLANESQDVLVYLEVENFASELSDNGDWLTKLDQKLEIYDDASGIRAWSVDWQPAVDRSATRRQDFFTTQRITLPERLSIGRYQLKVTMRDILSGAEAESSVTFDMTADPARAARIP